MNKLPSSRAPSCAVDTYIGSDFDNVMTVAQNIDKINEVADYINLSQSANAVSILRTVGHSIVGTFKAGCTVNTASDYVMDAQDNVYHYVGDTYPYVVAQNSLPDAKFVMGYRDSVADWRAFDDALLSAANIPETNAEDTTSNSLRLSALIRMGLVTYWKVGKSINTVGTLLKYNDDIYKTTSAPVILGNTPDQTSNIVKWSISFTEVATLISKTYKDILNILNKGNYVGEFKDGVTFTTQENYALDTSGRTWIYVGSDPLPRTFPQNFQPTTADFEVIILSDHKYITNRNDPNAHEASAISRGSSNVDVDLLNVENEITKLKHNTVKQCSEWGLELLHNNVTPIIDCYGDSTMWGATINNLGTQDPNNAPASLAVALQLLFNKSVTINNHAISGSTLRGMISGTEAYTKKFEDEFKAGGKSENSHIIYCNHGINDSQLDYDISQYRLDLYEFVQITRKYGKTPVIVTANPNPPIQIINDVKSKRLRKFVETARSVAADLNVDIVDQFHWFERSFNHINPVLVVPDGAHLSSRAYLQAGFNMAIPLISANTLKHPGDTAGLTNVSFYDNAGSNNNRQIQVRNSSCGPMITFESNGVDLVGINYPFILEAPLPSIYLNTLNYPFGGRASCKLNNYSFTTHPVIFKNDTGSSDSSQYDWDAMYNVYFSNDFCWAGLNVISLLLDNSFSTKTLGFAGVKIPLLAEWSSVVRRDVNIKKEPINQYKTILIPSVTINDGSVALKLNNKFGSKVLDISKTGGQITIKLYYEDAVIQSINFNQSNIPDGDYPVQIDLEPTKVNCLISGIGQVVNLALPLPEVVLMEPWEFYLVENIY